MCWCKILREGDIVQAGSLQFTAIETQVTAWAVYVCIPGHLFTDLIFREVVGGPIYLEEVGICW